MENHSDNLSRVERRKSQKKKWPKILLIIFIVLGLVLSYVYIRVRQTSDNIHRDLSEEEYLKEEHESRLNGKVNLQKKDPFSILLMGIDTGDKGRVDRGRSDTMMLLTVNPKNKKTTILSIPRDTRTEIVGKGKEDKINHAYAYGGPTMAMNTVQKLVDLPVDYFVSVNMKGIQQIVEAVGGVEITPNLTFNQDGYSFVQGEKRLVDGAGALAYSRMRKKDPQGDYGRQARQRELVKAILDKAASFGSILRFESLLQTAENNVQTNLKFNEMLTISVNYLPALTNVKEIQMQGEGKKIDGIYYDIVSEEEKESISQELKRELDLSE